MSHGSDLPWRWKGDLRRAFNVRANELAGFQSEAGPFVRAQLLAFVERFQREAARWPSDAQTADFIAGVSFLDLYQPRHPGDTGSTS
jgi:hypothetical protein